MYCVLHIYICTYMCVCNNPKYSIMNIFIGFVNENETLFTYNQQIDQSWVSFYDPNFQPVFTVTANENQRMFCRSNSFCLYDIAVTGSMEIATSTLESSNQYDKIVQLSYPGDYV